MNHYLWIIGIIVSLISFIGFILLYNYICHQCTNYEYSNIVLFLIFFSFIMFIVSCYGVNGDVNFGCSTIDLFKHKINVLIKSSQDKSGKTKCIDFIKMFEDNKKEALILNFNLEEYLSNVNRINNPGQKCEVNLDLTSFEKVANIPKLKSAFYTLLENSDYNNIAKNKSILEIFVNSSYDSINENILKNEFSKKHILNSINDLLNKYLKPENMVIVNKLFLEK